MAKDKQKPVPIKKGVIINRRNNRTVNQSVAQHEPKWQHVMNVETNPPSFTGAIELKKNHNVVLRRDRKTGHWQGISPRSV